MTKTRRTFTCSLCHRLFYSLGQEGQRLCRPHWARDIGIVPKDAPIAQRTKQGPQCSASGCQRLPVAKQLCWTHYQRRRLGASIDAPLKRTGPDKLEDEVSSMRMAPFAMLALRRRSKATGVRINAIVRALVERWAMTEGAERKPVVDSGRKESAWAKSESEMSRDH
jgi:hypothetical protein